MKKESIGNVHIELNLDHITGNLDKAQIALNQQIVADSTPYIPFRQGALRSQVRYPDGMTGGTVEWYAPYAHYQYMGEVYGPNIPLKDAQGNIIGWTSPPKKSPTGRKLQYHTPETSGHWFDRAKREHLSDWVRLVKETVGDG